MWALQRAIAVSFLLGTAGPAVPQVFVPLSLLEDARRPPGEFVIALAGAGLSAGLEIRATDHVAPSRPPRPPHGRSIPIGAVLAAFNAARDDYAAELVSGVVVVRPVGGRLALLDAPSHIRGTVSRTGIMTAAREVFGLRGPVAGSGSRVGEDVHVVLSASGSTTRLDLLTQIVLQASPRAWVVRTFEYQRSARVLDFGFLEASGAHQHQGIREQRPPDIVVDDARPLAAVIAELERRHGWRITYEDTLYLFAADMLDVTDAVRRSGDPSTRVLVPRGGAFTFEYPARPTEPATVLEALLEAYHWSGHPGRFRILSAGTAYHVVPVMARDAAGAPQRYSSPLNVRIAMPKAERSVLETLDAVVSAVTAAAGRPVGLGTVPINLLARARATLAADDEPARVVARRALDATGRPLSWRLLCDPGAASTCALNVHVVPAAR